MLDSSFYSVVLCYKSVNFSEVFDIKHFLAVLVPILVEDCTYKAEPQSVKNIVRFLKDLDPHSTRNDLLICLIYVLFLETGLIPKGFYDDKFVLSSGFNIHNVKKLTLKLPVGWKNHKLYKLGFILPVYPEQEISVVCVLSAGDIVVNCIVNEIDGAQYTVCLDPLLYFSTSNCDVSNFHLQNVKHLSRTIKSTVCYPIKQAILRYNDVVAECFESLPPEIVMQIMWWLDIRSLIQLGQVNSVCNNVMKTPKLWRHLLIKDFPVAVSIHVQTSNWKQSSYEKLRGIYLRFYFKKNKVSRQRERIIANIL